MPPPSSRPRAAPPQWVLFSALLIGVGSLLFIMAVVLLPAFGVTLPCESYRLVSILVGLGLALAFGFIGGVAEMSGKVPIPFLEGHPIRVALSGGVAAFVVGIVAAQWALGRCSDAVRPTPAQVARSEVDRAHDDIAKLRGDYEAHAGTEDDEALARVRASLGKAIDAILLPDDALLNRTHLIVKYEYAAYGKAMLAQLARAEPRIALARAAESYSRIALSACRDLYREASGGDAAALRDRDHVESETQHDCDRATWLLAWALSLRARELCASTAAGAASERHALIREAGLAWDAMSAPFRERNGVSHEKELRWALGEYARGGAPTLAGTISTKCIPP
jgi:hypothetical protein